MSILLILNTYCAICTLQSNPKLFIQATNTFDMQSESMIGFIQSNNGNIDVTLRAFEDIGTIITFDA